MSAAVINAQIKLTEVWKSLNIKDYPTQWTNRNAVQKSSGLKISNKPELVIKGTSHTQSLTFMIDAAKVWNNAPRNIKECKTQISAKKFIKLYIQTLPI